MDRNKIPAMTHPLSSAWFEQPNPENVLTDDTYALMSKSDFSLLHEYSTSDPSGVYAGKMWKLQLLGWGRWYLRWYSDAEGKPGFCDVNTREILVTE